MSTLEVRPAKALLKLRLCMSWFPGMIAGVVLAAIFARTHLEPLIGFGLGFLPLTALIVSYTIAHFRTIQYEIEDRKFTNSEGVFWKVRRSTPLDKITNVDVRQGPLERFFGIGQVWIFTPSTGALTPEARMQGIENSHEMKSLILVRSETAKKPAAASPASQSNPAPDESLSLLRQIAASLKKIEAALAKNGDSKPGGKTG
jgi:membrane protein YdbS with pleckstrin-like domain